MGLQGKRDMLHADDDTTMMIKSKHQAHHLVGAE